MAANTITSYDAVLKEVWPQDAIYDCLFEDAPLLSMLPKETDFYEKIRHIAIGIGTGQGVGTQFLKAQQNKSASIHKEFQLSTSQLYTLFSITRKLIKQSKNDRGSIIKAVAKETERHLKAWKAEMAQWLVGNGGGAKARGDSAWTVTGNTVTLSSQAAIVFIENGMKLQSASTDGSSGAVNAGSVEVNSINYTNGTFTTLETNIQTAIPAVANSDYWFREGDFGAAMPGIGSFIWDGNGGSPPVLYGMVRTSYVERQAGLRVASAGLPRETAMKAVKDVAIFGGKSSHYFLTPTDLLALQLDLQSAGIFFNTKAPGEKIGSYTFGMPFEGIGFMGAKGMVKCFMDVHLTPGEGLLLEMPSWTLASMGELCYIEDTDGKSMLREASADAYETRIVGDPCLYTEMPSHNARVTQ
jgi:hypothetical protein